YPVEVHTQCRRELRQPREPRPGVEADKLQTSKLFGDVVIGNRLEDNRQQPLRQLNRPLHLPCALLRLDRFRRDDKYDCVGLRNQAAEARLPILASRDVVAVEEWREATIFETRHHFVRARGRIPPRIGDEDLELLACASVGHTVTQRDLNEGRGLRIGHYGELSPVAWRTSDDVGHSLQIHTMSLAPMLAADASRAPGAVA